MEIRVQFPRERTKPAGPAGPLRPHTDQRVDPGGEADDRPPENGRQHRPSPDADIGGHVDKTA
jgi:hypothetical protein